MNARVRVRRASIWWTVIPIIILIVVAVVVALIAVRADRDNDTNDAVDPRPPLATAEHAVTPVSDQTPVPSPAAIASQIAKPAGDKALGTLTGHVSDAVTGQLLWSKDPAKPMTPASSTKLLTAAAALLTLPNNATVATKVVAGDNGRIYLVGGGDPTLSTQPDGAPTFFTDAPRISALAKQIKESGISVSSVAVDTSAFTGPSFAPSWETADIAGGSIAPIESVMTSSGRIKPTQLYSPRSSSPAIAAGKALATALGVASDSVINNPAPVGGRVVASVNSAPLSTRLRDMLVYSDDVLAETIAIEVSRATNGPASLAGGMTAVIAELRKAGFAVDGVRLRDTNGLSVDDRIPASVLDDILRASASSGDGKDAEKAKKLRPLLSMLPVAGASGTLADRFGADTGTARGWTRAKTGTLDGVSALAGTVQTRDNRVLTFALLSNGTSPEQARPALDALVGRLRDCGCQ